MTHTSLAAVANSKGLTHDWLLGSGAVKDTASDMPGTVQQQAVMFPMLLLNESLASFDPFLPPQIYLPIPCLLTPVSGRPLWVSRHWHILDSEVKHAFLLFRHESNTWTSRCA